VCFHALGCPKVAEGEIADWNKAHPALRLSRGRYNPKQLEEALEEFPTRTVADQLYSELSILRARLTPPGLWPARVQRFAQPWEEWKHAGRMLDFTDLLERALAEWPVAPGNPAVIVVDEGQDLSRLQLAIVRQWGASAQHLLIALDDDQTILAFAGADPEAFIDPGALFHFEHTLAQSYRIPRSHHALSQRWIEQLSRRQPKVYQPRDTEGELRVLHQHYRYPDPIVRDLEPYLAAGKSIMLLATSKYLLEPLRRRLLECGLPFANPYRLSDLDWNPLTPPPRGPAPADRFLSLVKPFLASAPAEWFPRELELWFSLLSNYTVSAQARKQVRALNPVGLVTVEMLQTFLEPRAYHGFSAAVTAATMEPVVDWWLDHLARGKRTRGRYLARIVRRYGVDALHKFPQITIGTGHSVKGAEADVVYVFPDLSPAAHRQWIGPHSGHDSLIRLAYVMITRGRETLILCDPAASGYLPIAACLRRLQGSTSM
jgi:superfamily I DNA/RNA helicase